MTTVIDIHPSDVNAALLCPQRLIEDTEKAPSYQMMRGTVVHTMIADTLKGAEVEPHFATQRALDEYEHTLLEFPYPTAITKLMTDALLAYEKWHEKIYPHLDLEGEYFVEHERKSTLWNSDEDLDIQVDLVGTPDLVDGNGAIHDWKTASRMWEANKPPGQMQPPLYAHLVAAEPVPFVFWVFDFSKGEWEGMTPIIPTQQQMNAATDQAVDIALSRHAKWLIANPGQPPAYKTQTRNWWCSPKYCHRWNNCEAKFLVNDGSEYVIARWEDEWEEADAG